jgi:hypothetical protein
MIFTLKILVVSILCDLLNDLFLTQGNSSSNGKFFKGVAAEM